MFIRVVGTNNRHSPVLILAEKPVVVGEQVTMPVTDRLENRKTT
jgi:hypothetical protein